MSGDRLARYDSRLKISRERYMSSSTTESGDKTARIRVLDHDSFEHNMGHKSRNACTPPLPRRRSNAGAFRLNAIGRRGSNVCVVSWSNYDHTDIKGKL